MRHFTKALRGIIVYLFLFAYVASAQESQDTAVYTVARGEDVRLNLTWTSTNHGLIQWQIYSGNDNWEDIFQATNRNLKIKADSNSLLRAKITSGACDPVFSAITGLKVLDIRTIKMDSITDTRAVVFCSADTSAGPFAETGVLIDTKAIPDSTSTHIINSSGKTSFTIELNNLVSGRNYYVRVYAMLSNGQLLMGNILPFTTYKIEALNRINLTDSTASVWYSITGDTASVVHGIFYSATIPDTNALSQPGISDGNRWKSNLAGLDAGTSYYAVPYFRKYNTYHLGSTIHFITYTDYSHETVDTSTFTIAHKITWKPYATARKISQAGFYADYGRVKRVGTSDTLLLVYHGGENNQDWLNVYMRKSYDNGTTWQDQQIMADISEYPSIGVSAIPS